LSRQANRPPTPTRIIGLEDVEGEAALDNISPTRRYPPILITAAVNDDRVQPGHARKMTAALQAAGHRVLYYERTEGGHGGAINAEQSAFNMALTHEFLLRTLVDGRQQPTATGQD
jgi:prolyl oligopeptidase PreP (S9A serine peptidase family)